MPGVTTAELALALDYAGYKRDLDTVQKITGDGMANMARSADVAKMVFGALGAALSVAALTSMVKGTIETAAAMQDLGIKTGASVEALSALAAVGKMSGTSADTIANAMNKLAKNMSGVDENGKGAAAALRTLGIDFDTFKQLSPDQQMKTLADAMGGFADGSGKSAIAMTLFGKAGADLLPMMADLADAEQLNAKLTDEQAAQAKEFEVNMRKLGTSGDAWKKQLSLGILPALTEVSQATLELFNGTGGLGEQVKKLAADGTLADWARGAVTAFTYLIDVGQGLFSLIPMLGKVIAGVAAGTSTLFGGIFEAMNKLKSGDFSGAWDSLKAGFNGVKEVATSAGTDISNIWGQKLMGQALRDRMADIKGTTGALKEQRPELQFNAAALKEQAAATDKARQAGVEWLATLEKQAAALQDEEDKGRKLTKSELELLDLESKLKSGKIALTDAEIEHAKAVIASNIQHEKNIKWISDTAKENLDALAAIDKNTTAIDGQVKALRSSTEVMGASATGIHAHELALIDDKIAADNAKKAIAELAGNTAMVDALDEEIGKWQELKVAKDDAFNKKSALEAQKNWIDAATNISNGFADALTHGIKSGLNYIKNLLKSEAIKFVLQPVMGSVMGGIGSLLPTAASAAGGVGGEVSGLANLGSLFGSGGVMSTLGSFGATGFMSTVTGTGLGTTLGAAGSLMEGGSIAGGLGMGVGAVAPYVLAAAALYSMLNKKATPHVGGYAMADASGGVSDITAQQGGIQQAETQTAVASLASTLASLLNSTSATFGGAGGYSVRSVFESDNKDPSWGLFHLLQNGAKSAGSFDALGTLNKDSATGFAEYAGMAAEGVRTALESLDLPKWASQALDALGKAPSVENLAAAVTKINAMQKALIDMGTAVQGLGGPFDQVALLSSDAKNQLAQFTGGIDAFITKTRGYVSSYYTEAEQMAIAARDVQKQLGAVGINGAAATTKNDLRTLMESLDPGKEDDRKKMAALLNVASEYASVGAYLEKEHLTLGQLADQSPQVAAISQLQNPTETTASATAETAATVKDVATSTADTAASTKAMAEGVDTQTSVLADGLKQMLERLDLAVAALKDIDERMRLQEARAT